jgi:hypothetical protein
MYYENYLTRKEKIGIVRYHQKKNSSGYMMYQLVVEQMFTI